MNFLFGGYITGWGLLFRIVDAWTGNNPELLLENVENGKYAWMPVQVVREHCEEVDFAS
jgi:hypothetical protein